MDDNTLRKRLNRIMEELKESKDHWRFNYSVGLSNGCCYGSSYEDDKDLKRKRERNKK